MLLAPEMAAYMPLPQPLVKWSFTTKCMMESPITQRLPRWKQRTVLTKLMAVTLLLLGPHPPFTPFPRCKKSNSTRQFTNPGPSHRQRSVRSPSTNMKKRHSTTRQRQCTWSRGHYSLARKTLKQKWKRPRKSFSLNGFLCCSPSMAFAS